MRIRVPLGVAVVGRVGEDQDARGPALLGVVDLEAPEDLAVADQDDLALGVDPHLLECGEVVGATIVRVDHLPVGSAGDAVAVERAERLAARRILVGRDGCFVQCQLLLERTKQGQLGGDRARWIVEQHLQLDQVGLPAPFAELVPDEDGRLVIGGGAGDVGLGGEDAEPPPRVLRRGDRQGVGLGGLLFVQRSRRESDDRGCAGADRTLGFGCV